MEIALQLYSMGDDDYNDDGYDNYDGYNNYGSNDYGYYNNIVEELEYELQLLWTTFLSIYTKHTFVGHRLDQERTTTSPQSFKLVDPGGVHSTSAGRVTSGRLHLYNLFGITIPPPTVSRYNQPCLCHHTGLRLGSRDPDNHRKPLLIRGIDISHELLTTWLWNSQ